jgi:hypothetical protein
MCQEVERDFFGGEHAKLGRNGAPPVHEVRCGSVDVESFLTGATVKAARGRRTPHRLRGETKTRRDGRAERAPPLQRSALQEVQGIHVDEDGGLGDFFGVGVGEGAG